MLRFHAADQNNSGALPLSGDRAGRKGWTCPSGDEKWPLAFAQGLPMERLVGQLRGFSGGRRRSQFLSAED